MKDSKLIFMIICAVSFFLSSCKDDNKSDVRLNVAEEFRNLSFDAETGRKTIKISGPEEWHVNSSESWCTSSHSIGEGEQYVNIIVENNNTKEQRNATITISAQGAADVIINIKQSAIQLPQYDEYIDPDNADMRNLTSMQLSALMSIGINIGNTYEALIIDKNGNASGDETSWGNAVPTKQLFQGIKNAGFTVVRMPLAFSHQLEDPTTFKIKDSWLDKIEQSVKDALENKLFIIINCHWDGGWLIPNEANKDYCNAKLEAIWKQLALRFRNYDDRLLFAGTNEVNDESSTGGPTAENYKVQNNYNQLFVNTVRATGGRNHYRHLLVQSYVTDVKFAVHGFQLPVDIVDNRLFLECHYYDPYDFTLMSSDTPGYKTQWGAPFSGGDVSSTGQEEYMETTLGSLKKFIDSDVPVIIGEYGVILRNDLKGNTFTKHLEARNYYFEYLVKTCFKNKLIPLYWDAGYSEKLFDRVTGEQYNPESIQAMLKGLK